ncbi:MAG: amidase [Hyphomicrobium sp.]|nr:amidase [Hyphomicrobium sp.]
MTANDPTRLSATEAAAALKAGTLTSQALVSACLERIKQRDQDVAAWAFVDAERVLREAREADTLRNSGAPLQRLAGLPVGIKDIIDTAEYPTEYGCPVFKGNYPSTDATIVGELKRAGAIILGKTVTTELAFFGPGKTRNPHNREHTPGGSSSGSAAAVADFQVPLALGTQTAGSVIRPASFCGTVGFKPTFGYISRTGIMPQSPPLDTVGTYARTIDDIALLTDAISAFDPRDGDMTSSPKAPLSAGLSTPLDRAPRFAFIISPSGAVADPEAVSAYEQFASGFGARAEVVVTQLPAEFDGALRLHRIVQFSDIAKNFGPIADKNPGAVTEKLKEAIAEGRTFSSADIAAARAERDPLYDALRPILINYDAILTPAAPGPAPHGLSATGNPMFNALWTYLGMPCISLPLLEAGGLPLGVQLVAARGNDAGLLRVAKWLYPGDGRSA